MNTIIARVEIRESLVVYEYEINGIIYELQTPKTDLNKHLKDGEMVIINMSINEGIESGV